MSPITPSWASGVVLVAFFVSTLQPDTLQVLFPWLSWPGQYPPYARHVTGNRFSKAFLPWLMAYRCGLEARRGCNHHHIHIFIDGLFVSVKTAENTTFYIYTVFSVFLLERSDFVSGLFGKASATATNLVLQRMFLSFAKSFGASKICPMAPVPRPPMPTTATRIVSLCKFSALAT